MHHSTRRSWLRSELFDPAWRLCLLGALAGGIAGCASINHFSVTPRSACQGDTVKAAWAANGSVHLTSQPAVKGTGKQPSTGEKTFVVDETTRFVLHATRLFGHKTAEADVAVAPQEVGYGAIAQCSTDNRLITAQVALEHQLSGQFRVDAVGNPLDRALRISKAGHTAVISAHGQSAAFRGDPAQGTWQLASPLTAGETCISAMHALRQRLQMQLKLQCGD